MDALPQLGMSQRAASLPVIVSQMNGENGVLCVARRLHGIAVALHFTSLALVNDVEPCLPEKLFDAGFAAGRGSISSTHPSQILV